MTEENKNLNPYDKSDEGNFNNWQHGFNSLDKDDCPYQDGMLEYDTAYPVWMSGFNAGRKARKSNEKANPPPAPKPETKKAPGRPKTASGASVESGDALTEEQLMERLKALKRPRYEELKAELAKLEWLFGDENV